MEKTDYLELVHISDEHWDRLNSFELSKEQGQFTLEMVR